MTNINIHTINNIFKDRESKPIQSVKKAAVMILLEVIDKEIYIIFQVRAKKLNHQPGDICLPGGKVEPGENFKEAAIRETMEEMNIKKEEFEVLGEMDYFISPYKMIVRPYIAKINTSNINYNKNEVDHIFKVPLKFFIDTDPLLYKMDIGPINQEGFPFHLINGGKDYKFSKCILEEYFYQWNKYVIWGFTAHIIKSFIDIIKMEIPPYK